MSLPHYSAKKGRWLGRPLGWLYGLGAWLHRAAYVYGPLQRTRFDPPVICVGNLSVGGTGKSPHVQYVQRLLGQPARCAMVSRGYGRQSKGVYWVGVGSTVEEVGDEPLQFKRAFPDATVVVAERRAEGIQVALSKVPDLAYILLDDAMQHWGVVADCTLLLTTFSDPFFQQELLPFGRLREFRKGYQRADVIVVTQCPHKLAEATKNAYRQAIQPLSHQLLLFSSIVYQALYDLLTGEEGPQLAQIPALDILVVTGIADTRALRAHLAQFEHRVSYRAFPDHHNFTASDWKKLAASGSSQLLLTTEKDAPKLRPLVQQDRDFAGRVYVLPIRVALSPKEEALLLERLKKA
jgi:tetraacyldisaccharide 4'-kinase